MVKDQRYFEPATDCTAQERVGVKLRSQYQHAICVRDMMTDGLDAN